jgi:hypothetical protein
VFVALFIATTGAAAARAWQAAVAVIAVGAFRDVPASQVSTSMSCVIWRSDRFLPRQGKGEDAYGFARDCGFALDCGWRVCR